MSSIVWVDWCYVLLLRLYTPQFVVIGGNYKAPGGPAFPLFGDYTAVARRFWTSKIYFFLNFLV